MSGPDTIMENNTARICSALYFRFYFAVCVMFNFFSFFFFILIIITFNLGAFNHSLLTLGAFAVEAILFIPSDRGRIYFRVSRNG